MKVIKVKHKLLCLLIPALLLSCGENGKDKPDTPPEGKAAQITVMSFNVRSSTIAADTGDRHWDRRKGAVQKMVKEIRPDVIGMQEATKNQRQDLKNLLDGYELFEVPGTGTSKGGNTVMMYNTAVLEALQCKSFFLSCTPEKPSVNGWNEETQYRTTIWAQFRHKESGKEFFVADTHMPLGSEARDNTARTNAATLNVSRMKAAAGDEAPLFIIGDMNTSLPEKGLAPYYEWLSNARDKAVKTDATLSFNNYGGGSNSNLDHIFYRNVIVSEFRTVSGKNYGVAYISDHYPVICYATIL